MCGGGGAPPPTPQAPPAPTPVRDNKIEAKNSRVQNARRAASSGYESTMLTSAGGDTSNAPTTSAKLGA